MRTELQIIGGLRTPFGRAKGSLKGCAPFELARQVGEELLARCEIVPDALSGVVLCTALPTVFPPFPARLLARELGLPPTAVAYTVTEGSVAPILALQRFCGTDGPFLLVGADSATSAMGRHEGGTSILDRMSVDPDTESHLSAEADAVAARYGLSPEDQDSIAIESHAKAARARDEGHLDREIVPVVPPPDYEGFVRDDQVIQDEADARRFGTVPAIRGAAGGTVTHATIGLPSDGAAALVLRPATPESTPTLCRARAGLWGAPRKTAALGFAVQTLLQGLDLQIEAIDAVELHERSAAHVLAALKVLGYGVRQKVNCRGGAIALGDVPGATVIRHVVTLASVLKHGQRGVVAASSGGLCGAVLVTGAER